MYVTTAFQETDTALMQQLRVASSYKWETWNALGVYSTTTGAVAFICHGTNWHVHPRLVCNFDQVWSLMFRPQKKTLQRTNQTVSLLDPLMKSKYLRQLRHNVERSLDLPLTEGDPKCQVKEQPTMPVLQGSTALPLVQWINGANPGF